MGSEMCIRDSYYTSKKLLNILTTRVDLNRHLAATPAPFFTSSSCLAARPLVLYLGARDVVFPVAGGVYTRTHRVPAYWYWPPRWRRWPMVWFPPFACLTVAITGTCLRCCNCVSIKFFWQLSRHSASCPASHIIVIVSETHELSDIFQ